MLLFTRFFEFDLGRVVRIASQVMRVMPSARLLVVGKGLFGEDERFRELVEEAGVSERVIYIGWVGAEELPEYFAASDVAIYPFEDNLVNRTKCSVKLIALLAAGVPVVADAVGQNMEYIENGVTGLLVRHDVDSFSESIIEVLCDPDFGKSLGTAARERISRDFDWRRLAGVAERAYGA
jgi:glycosyltransferase involved in cell wall biosynthesis